MIGTIRRGHSDQRGLTLVQLLVVVTILGVLAAVVTASLVDLSGSAGTNTCLTEANTVQSAMDAMMAKNSITAVTAQGTATNSFTALPTGTGAQPLSPTFIRQATSKGFYTWDSAGAVTQTSCP